MSLLRPSGVPSGSLSCLNPVSIGNSLPVVPRYNMATTQFYSRSLLGIGLLSSSLECVCQAVPPDCKAHFRKSQRCLGALADPALVMFTRGTVYSAVGGLLTLAAHGQNSTKVSHLVSSQDAVLFTQKTWVCVWEGGLPGCYLCVCSSILHG